MREYFNFGGSSTGEYKSGLYAVYCGKEYPAVYLGSGRYILYSNTRDENFAFPSQDGRFLMQTDLRDENLTHAYNITMVGVVKNCCESVTIMGIFEDGVLVSTDNARLGLELKLEPTKDDGFIGLIERQILIGMYDERDYLWNSTFGICATLCTATGAQRFDAWFAEKDRLSKYFRFDNKKVPK
jgi:hypothetical protein